MSCNSGPRYGRLVPCYETGAGAPLVVSVTYYLLQCWLYLYLRVNHLQVGDLTLREEDLVTIDRRLAVWRHGTKRVRVARLVYSITYHWSNAKLLAVSTPQPQVLQMIW